MFTTEPLTTVTSLIDTHSECVAHSNHIWCGDDGSSALENHEWSASDEIAHLDELDYTATLYSDSIFAGCDLVSNAADKKYTLSSCAESDRANVCSALCAAYGHACHAFELHASNDDCSLHTGMVQCTADSDCSGSDVCFGGFCAQSDGSRLVGMPFGGTSTTPFCCLYSPERVALFVL